MRDLTYERIVSQKEQQKVIDSLDNRVKRLELDMQDLPSIAAPVAKAIEDAGHAVTETNYKLLENSPPLYAPATDLFDVSLLYILRTSVRSFFKTF
jgi:hypothetical protein